MQKEMLDHADLLAQQEQEPNFYQVIMHNDDFTPMEFVVDILEKFFFMDRRKATDIMLEVHTKGSALCGIYTREIAESKIVSVLEHAKINEHPLICSMEAAK